MGFITETSVFVILLKAPNLSFSRFLAFIKKDLMTLFSISEVFLKEITLMIFQMILSNHLFTSLRENFYFGSKKEKTVNIMCWFIFWNISKSKFIVEICNFFKFSTWKVSGWGLVLFGRINCFSIIWALFLFRFFRPSPMVGVWVVS